MEGFNWPNAKLIQQDSLVVKVGGLSAVACAVWVCEKVPGRRKRR